VQGDFPVRGAEARGLEGRVRLPALAVIQVLLPEDRSASNGDPSLADGRVQLDPPPIEEEYSGLEKLAELLHEFGYTTFLDEEFQQVALNGEAPP